MLELLSQIPGSDLTTVLIVVPAMAMAGLLGITVLVITAVQRRRQQEMAATLLMEMAEDHGNFTTRTARRLCSRFIDRRSSP